MIPFTKKYEPKNISEIVGQENAIKNIIDMLNDWKKGSKAILIYGPSGCGKTASAHVLANHFGYELYEINASDTRNKEQIEQKINSAIKQYSLFSKGKIILIDEIDGLAGNKDRGGLATLTKLISESAFPMIFTIQNPWDYKFNSLKKKCSLVEFGPLDANEMVKVLMHVCKKDSIKYDESVLKGLCRRSGGDCRAALNDLEMLSSGTKEVTKESLEELEDRSREESMPNALLRVFKSTDPKVAIGAFDSVKEDIDQQFLWIDENLPHEYDKAKDIAMAYDKISKADVFKRRIRRWQHWRFLIYVNALLTAGVAVSKDEKYKKFVKYKPTGRILKLWWAKQKSMKKKAIAAKIAEKTHSSTREVIKDIEYFKLIFKKNKEMAKGISEYLDLDKDEVAWLKK